MDVPNAIKLDAADNMNIPLVKINSTCLINNVENIEICPTSCFVSV